MLIKITQKRILRCRAKKIYRTCMLKTIKCLLKKPKRTGETYYIHGLQVSM